MMNATEWVRNEWAYFLKENGGDENWEEHVGKYYDSACKAFETLLDENDSKGDIFMKKTILNRFLSGLPLTPIKDDPDIWIEGHVLPFHKRQGIVEVYQCSRLTSLYKWVKEDGSIIFSDLDRIICRDENNTTSVHSIVTKLIDEEIEPIRMPYRPSGKKIRVNIEEGSRPGLIFVSDAVIPSKKGEYRHINIFRYYDFDKVACTWDEISEEEYKKRVRNYSKNNV